MNDNPLGTLSEYRLAQERLYWLTLIKAAAGNRSLIVKMCGMNRTSMYKCLHRVGITLPASTQRAGMLQRREQHVKRWENIWRKSKQDLTRAAEIAGLSRDQTYRSLRRFGVLGRTRRTRSPGGHHS